MLTTLPDKSLPLALSACVIVSCVIVLCHGFVRYDYFVSIDGDRRAIFFIMATAYFGAIPPETTK